MKNYLLKAIGLLCLILLSNLRLFANPKTEAKNVNFYYFQQQDTSKRDTTKKNPVVNPLDTAAKKPVNPLAPAAVSATPVPVAPAATAARDTTGQKTINGVVLD